MKVMAAETIRQHKDRITISANNQIAIRDAEVKLANNKVDIAEKDKALEQQQHDNDIERMRKDHASKLAAQQLKHSAVISELTTQKELSEVKCKSDAERLQEKVKQLQDSMEQLQSSRDAGLEAQVNALQSRLDEANEAKVSASNDLKAAEITGDSLKQSHAALQKELVNVKEQLEEVQQEATKERDAAVALVNARLVEAQNQAKATEGTLQHLQKVQQVMFETSEASKKRSGELEVANAGMRREYEGLQEEHAMLEEVQRETKAQVKEWYDAVTEREEFIGQQQKALLDWVEAYNKLKAELGEAPDPNEYAEDDEDE